ncbi:MAG TPA: CBS domain-containing protein [Rhodanobacteraceae bacterium]|nr:CBS domain-containing protein [Rhodanobacteraceae bacterium]
MNIHSVMTPNPRYATPRSSLHDIACMMRDEDVGEIPIAEVDGSPRLVGVITDRDIVVRAVAGGGDLAKITARECMTEQPVTVTEDATLEDCARLMASQRVRRVPVVDSRGMLCGIVSQSDLQATDARSLKQEVADRVSTPH